MSFRLWLQRVFRFARRPRPIRKFRTRLAVEALEDRVLLTQPGFLVLDPTASGAVQVSGNASIRAVSGFGIVDSRSASAVDLTGHGYVSVGELDVVGSPGVRLTGQARIGGLVRAGIAAQIDPLATLPAPTAAAPFFSAACGTSILSPGTYENGIHISGQAFVTLRPGVYYLKGGFEVSGQAHVVGKGVTIYLSGEASGDHAFELSGQAVVSLSPATSGIYRGITVFQARSDADELAMSGNAVLNLVGTIYAAHGKLDVTGNAVLNGGGDSVHGFGSQFIGYDLTATGNGKIVLDPRNFTSLTLTANLSPAPIPLPDGSLVTNAPNGTISGKTAPLVNVALETGSDVRFDEGSIIADSSGSYSLPVVLAEGINTLQVLATANGQQATQTIQVILDTVAPRINVGSPAPGLTTNQNVTITGTVADDRSGVASFQAALDSGVLAPVTLGAGGSFTLSTTLPLDHTADGLHTEHFKATDKAGNISFFDVVLTLDTVAPSIVVNSPTPGVVTNQNVSIAGNVSDGRSGVASLQEALDGGAFVPVNLTSGGDFQFSTTLRLDHTTDGAHTEHLRATDKAGNVSNFDVPFTLDTIPPAVDFHLDAAFDTPPVGDGHTQEAIVTLTGVTEPDTAVVLQETGAHTISDPATGAFSFAGVPLALGDNGFTVSATDRAGNVGTALHTITRDAAFVGATLVEGTRFLTPLDQAIIVPSQPTRLEFQFASLNFDTRATFIKDAFEASLTDANGNSLVLPIAGTRDAFLNITEGQTPVLSPNASLSAGTVDVDLSHIAAGTQARLRVRLVNNDSDTTTSVAVSTAQLLTGAMNTPNAVTPSAAAVTGASRIDFSALADVTSSMTVSYGQTSLNEARDVLFAGLSLKNTGTYFVDGPLVAVITRLSDPSIHVRNSDGLTADGLPYFDLSGLTGGSTLAPGQATGTRTLAFFNPNGIQFKYDLVILAHLNRPPTFTSAPNTEAIPGLPYVYQAAATDPDNDALTYSLLAGPTGMTVDPASGKVTWSPQVSDLGNESVLLQVDDGHGGTVRQQWTVSTIVAPPDRPPLFTSAPVIGGNVNTAYVYQATATDPDNDPLTFSLSNGPTGMTIDANTGVVNWTPIADELGTANVTITVADGSGGTATQSFAVNVLHDPKNQPPLITSDPVTQYNVPPASNPPTGDVNPGAIDLTLANGQTSNQTVSLTGLSGGPLTLGSLVTGNFGTPGQQDVYTFTLPTSALLYFDALSNNGFAGFAVFSNTSFQWSLTGPNTIIHRLFTMSDGSSNTNPVMALPAGTYTLTVSAGDQTTGTYAFRLSDLGAATPITPGTPVSDILDPGISTKFYQFNAVAGQSYYFASLGGSGSIFTNAWRLIDPFGNALFKQVPGAGGPFAQPDLSFLANDGGRLTLPFTGTYTVLLEGSIVEPGPVNFTINVEPITDTTQPLTLGSSVNGNLTSGQQDTYTFNLPANALVDFDSLTNNTNFQWSLSGPQGTVVSNRSFFNSDAGAFPNPVLALPAGAYTLTVTGTGRTSGPYAFRLSDLTTATTLMPGTAVSGTLNPGNRTNLYQFNATAGQPFYFARLSQGGAFLDTWKLIDPYGNDLFNNFLVNDAGRLTLTAGGTYTVLVEGDVRETGPVDYSFNVAPIIDTTQALTLGSTVNASLATPGQQDRYTFNLPASALLYFDALTNNDGLQWSLSGPGGTAVDNRSFTATDGRSIGTNPALALPAGAYTLMISGVGQTSGAYAFRLSNLATATPLTPGTPVNDTLSPANSTNLYQFTANAGDQYTITSQSAVFNSFWRLFDPYGNVVAANFIGNNVAPFSLTATGTYYLAVEGFIRDTGTESYTITAQFQGNTPPPAPVGTPLTLGSTVNGSITTVGQQDRYTFTLPANAFLYFDALATDGSLAWSLSGPGGAVVSNLQFAGSDAGHVTNNVLTLPAGSYTLTVSALFGSAPGPYAFRLLDLASAMPLTPGTVVNDTLNPANSTNAYRFDAAAGQSFYFAPLAVNGNNWWRLIDPYGNQLFSTFFNNDVGQRRLTVNAAGTYTLLVEGDLFHTGTFSYALNVAPITDTTQPLTLGSPVNAALATPGQQDRYTFTLPANALVYFDSLTNNSNLQWSLTGPMGLLFHSATSTTSLAFNNSDSFDVNGDPVLALPAGAYTLTVTGAGQAVGAYAFRLSDLSTATPLTPGTPVSGTLDPPDSTQFYQFNAVAGQPVYLAHLAGGSANNVWWRLIDPYGNMLFSNFVTVDSGRLTLTASGQYTVLVEGEIRSTGTLDYSFNVAAITDITQPLTLGTLVNGSVTSPGEQDHYSFTLPTNAQLYFDSLTNNSGLQWSLTGPTGLVVNRNTFSTANPFNSSDSGDLNGNPVLGLPPGVYILTVSGTGQTTGAYAFRLSDLSTATALTPGAQINGTLNPANSTQLYQFNAAAGQLVYLAHLSGGSSTTWWRLFDSYGNMLFSNNFGVDTGRLTLSAGGIYTVLVEGDVRDTGTVGYSFKVAPITDSTHPLTLGTVVSASLVTPGEQDRFTFNLASSAKLYFDSLTNSGNLQWSLAGPAGNVVNNTIFNQFDGPLMYAPLPTLLAGAYTLTVTGMGQTTGAYAFRLSDLATAAPLSPNVLINGQLNPANSTNLYQFAANAGDQYQFLRQGSNVSGAAVWRLMDPYGNTVFHSLLGFSSDPLTLSFTGTYFLFVEGGAADTGSTTYAFTPQFLGNVPPVAPSGTPLSLGSTVNGTLLTAGQQDRYVFTLPADAQLYFDSLTNNGGILWSLTGPAGAAVSNRGFNGSDGFNVTSPAMTLPAGTYVLTVTAPGLTAAAYSFRLSDLASAAPFSPNTPVAGKLSPGNSTNLHRFTAAAGDSFYFESLKIPFVLGTSSNSAQWRLLDPYGHVLFTTAIGSDAGRVTLPTSGTYTLLIEGAIQNTAPLGYTFRVDQPQVEVVPSDPNVPFANETGAVSDLNAATFNVQLAGNGQAQGFDLRFVSVATGLQLGAIPVTIDTQYIYQVRAVDPEGDSLIYQLTQAPTGMQIDPSSGLITWTPTAAQVGQNSVSVRVEDNHGGVDTQTFVVNVTSLSPGGIQGSVFADQNGDGNRDATSGTPPPVSGPFQPVGTPFPGIGIDSGPALIITIGPDGAISMRTTGQPPYENSEDTYVAVINQAISGVALQTLELSSDVDIFGFDFDGIGSDGKSGYEGPGVFYSDFGALTSDKVNFDDGSGTGLQPGQQTFFALEDIPTHITGTIVRQVAPTALEPGVADSTVYLDLNHNGLFDPSEPFSKTDALGHYFFSDLAPGAYTVALATQGFQITAPASGAFSAVVQSGQVASGLDFGVQPGVANSPTITSTAPSTAVAGQHYRYAVSVSNPDGIALKFDLPVKPDGMLVDPQTGVIAWLPSIEQAGPQDVVLRMQDARGDVVLQSFRINVAVESSPVITSTPPQPAQSGLAYQYQVQAQDAENDPLTYSLTEFPAGMTINLSTGLISWIGAPVGPGLPAGYRVTVQVSDGRGGLDSQSFTLSVITPGFDRPPVITSHPRTKIDFGTITDFYQVVASDPDGDPLSYSLPVAPAGMTINSSGLLHWLPLQSDVGVHPVEIEVDDGRGLKATQDFTITVTWQFSNQGPAITSVPPPSARAGSLYEYDATADDADGDALIWSLDSAPAGMSVNATTGTVRWTPTVDQLGSAAVVLRVTDGAGGFSTQSFTIAVRIGNTPPTITSKPPTQGAVGQLYRYAVKAFDADGDPLTYSLVTAPTGLVIDPSGVVQWAPTAAQAGPQQVIIDVDDGHGGGILQGFTILVANTASNQPPTITSTPGFVATFSQPYTYQATASDPEGDALHFALLNAPAGMIVDGTSGLVQWTPAITQVGPNAVLLAVTDTAGNVATQDVTITALSVNRPPAITSAPVTTITAGAAYHYDVLAVDPDHDPIAYVLTTAPAGMTIDPLGRITWSPQTGDIGSQSVVVAVDDGRGGTASQSFTINVAADTEAPQVSLRLSANPADLGSSVRVTISATDNVAVTSLTLTDNGVPVAIDASGNAIIAADATGSFTLVATVGDAAGNVGSDSQTLVVRDPHVTSAPTVDLTSPDDNATITAPTDIIGTVQDANLVSYTLSLAPFGSDSFTDFFTGTTQVINGRLGTLDPTMLQNDTYVLRLSALNTGGLISTVETTVNVTQNLKLGNFKLTFTDLMVPVAGIPITVTRTYDTLNAAESGDIGFGWQLGFRDVDLRTSVAKTGDEADGFFNPFRNDSHVFVTLPGGQREGFTFQPKVADGLRGSFIGIFEPNFIPDAGVTDSLTVDPADLRFEDDGTVYDFETGLAYNPADPNFGGSYLLTTKDGLAYSIDGFSGQLTEISDSNNNTLTFSDTGIVSSTGASVTFERDRQGRIAAVIDPAGNRIRYQYDANGDLVAVTDRTNNTTQFVYRTTPAHYLDKVIDPLGRTGARADYDAQGRLIKVIDADGNPVQMAYDPTHLIATVTDPFGNSIIEEYDDRGNTVRRTDALGNVTQQTFDANNNLLTHTDPLGRTTSYTYDDRGDALTQTDALGNTTIATFDDFTFFTTALAASRGQAAAPFTRTATATDALGNTTHYQNDFFGDLASETDPAGNTIAVLTGINGDPTSITDAAGNNTQYTYDAEGHVILAIDALGNATAFSYDADGNELTQTSTLTAADGSVRTLTTTNTYDAQGRLISVTDPEGGVTRTEYDADGNETATIDALGRRTEYVYDDRNNVIEVIYPDATPLDLTDNPRTQIEYDAVGRETAVIDELGRRTEYQYDALGRVVKTINPDGTFTQTEYNAAGEVTAQIDELGNPTTFFYDADGRQIKVRDALRNETISTYDAAGRKIADTDPLGHITRCQFDARGFVTETDNADGSKTTATTDNRGKVIAQTDALGRTTHFEYDAINQLTGIVDALGQRTQYAYDEAGDLIRQTDANGHVTIHEYDGLGRETATDLPALPGQAPYRSTTQYDAVGNVVSTTDFNGNTITFAYDERDRLIAKNYPDGTSVTYTYTLTGQQATVTDARGTTQYVYDTRDRLTSRTDPDGTTISYQYDAAGDRTAVTTPAGLTSYTFDALGREMTVTDPDGGITRYTYDAAGNLIRTELPNGVVETRIYDALNRLTFLEDHNNVGTIASFTYILGLTGQRDAVIENTGRRVDYSYDALDRLTEEKISDATLGNRAIDYTYDPVGNRLTMTDSITGETVYTYDAMDHLLTETLGGQVTQYTYDKNGNTLSRVSPTEAALYNWDFDNRLISADTNGDGVIDEVNAYDADGNRVAQTLGAVETRFLIDTVQAFPQVVLEYRPSGLIVASYVYGNSLISQNRSGVKSFYVVDALGSTRALTDAAGTVTDRYVYDAFGQILAQSGNTINTYLFAGQQRDSSLGMDYLRARFLNFNTGRFASADTFLGLTRMPLTLNKYLYTAQNPVNFTDPGGHFSLGDLAASDAIQGILDAVEAIGESQSFIKTVQAISDFIFVGTTALTILAAISVHGFKAGLAVELEEPNPDSAIKKFSFALTVDKGDLIATISVTTQGSDKLGYAEDKIKTAKINIDHPKKSKFSFSEPYKINLATVTWYKINVITLDLAIDVGFGVKASVKGAFGPMKLLKAEVKLFQFP